jgi:threonine/homoserine/homoserine lactone efflux protein
METEVGVLVYLLRGVLVGLVIAAPVGPIAMLCISRTLAEGRVAGLATGLGAATADAFYGAVAGFGLTAISTLLLEEAYWLRLAGGLVLCLMGLRTVLVPEAPRRLGNRHGGLIFDFSSTFLLTLANPVTILVVAAIFAGMAPLALDRLADVGLLVAGVFAGSAAWWLFLVASAGWLRAWLTPRVMLWVNRGAGAVIGVFGAVVLATALL